MPEAVPLPDTAPAVELPSAGHYVGYLLSLVDRDDGSARARLAELRRAGVDPSHRPRALSVVGDRIPDDARGWILDAYLLTAELLALYAAGGRGIRAFAPEEKQTTLGASARAVNPRKAVGEGRDVEYVDMQPGIGSRFSALLTLPHEDLPDELRRFMRLLRSKDAPIDFHRLLRDLIWWPNDNQVVQKTWARQYWAASSSSETPSDTTDTNT